MNKAVTFLVASILFASTAFCQISFTEDQQALANLFSSSGAPMGISDMNGDGLDDLISLDNTRNLFISFQNQDGSFNVIDYPTIGSGNWGMCIGDVENDGRKEIFTGGAYNDVRLIEYMDNGQVNTTNMNGPDVFVQAVSFSDINNDGFLDAVACHDDGLNRVYMNDGAGNLNFRSDNTLFIKANTEEGNSGNYGNIWSDVNGDGHMDYYIAKCRQAVTDMTDVRRVNQLWINDGQGGFTEQADSFGLAVGFQSWTTEFQDIDNDGDMDCFITNHDWRSQLFENIENDTFINITAQSGIDINGLPVQATMKDFDNDGFVDLFVTGTEGILMRNNGDKTFTEVSNSESGLTGNEHSFTSGDLNHDGFIDMMIGYGIGFNSPSSKRDRLWLNSKNDNHWLGVSLEGDVSNRDGIGSRIELYGEWGIMVREVRAGESYGISHSLTQHFGIGAATVIDSLVVRWPSGQVDSYEDVAVNQFVKLKEGNCITPPTTLVLDGSTTFCSGDDLTITAPAGYTYLWSNGATSQSIVVTTSGDYNVEISNGSDCSTTSVNVEVLVDPAESFEIFSNEAIIVCEGETVTLTTDLGLPVDWSTGQTAETITLDQSTIVTATAQGTCGLISSNELEVTVLPTPDVPSNFAIEYTGFGEVTLSADGTGISWYGDAMGQNLLGIGNELQVNEVFNGTTVYVESSSEDFGGILSGGESEHTGSSDYNSDAFNGSMIFFTFEPMVLRKVTVETDTPGERIIELKDNFGDQVLQSKSFMLEAGITTLDLNFEIEVGDGYQLTTNTAKNLEVLGTESPRLKRSSVDFGADLNYPYLIGSFVRILGTDLGVNFFYYFYNWEITPTNDGCKSEIIPFEIVPSSANDIDNSSEISIFPNPSSGIFNLRNDESGLYNIRIFSLNGTELIAAKDLSSDFKIDLSNFDAGIYILRMETGDQTFFSRLAKF